MLGWLVRIGLGGFVQAVVAFGLRILEREEVKRRGSIETQTELMRRRLEEIRIAQAARRDAAAIIDRSGVRATDPDERSS